jgi:CheY-like chemotaxis protein
VEKLGKEVSHQLMVVKEVRVLTVDNVPVNLIVAKGFLGWKGIVTDLAEDGYRAIDLVTKEDFNAVLMGTLLFAEEAPLDKTDISPADMDALLTELAEACEEGLTPCLPSLRKPVRKASSPELRRR